MSEEERPLRPARIPLRAMATAIGVFALLVPFADGWGLASAVLAALAGVALGEGLAYSRLRTGPALLFGLGVFLAAGIAARTLVGWTVFSSVLGPTTALVFASMVGLGLGTLGITAALRVAARRVPTLQSLELGIFALATAAAFAAHRDGALARPLWLTDRAWQLGVDPGSVLLAIGAAAATAIALLHLLETRHRLPWLSWVWLPAIALIAFLLADVATDEPQTSQELEAIKGAMDRPPEATGATGDPDDNDTREGEGTGEGDDGEPEPATLGEDGEPIKPELDDNGEPIKPEPGEDGEPIKPELGEDGEPVDPQLDDNGEPIKPELDDNGDPVDPQLDDNGDPVDPEDGDGMADAAPEDGDEEGTPEGGDPTDGEPTDGEPGDGDPTDGKPTDGDPRDGDPTDGEPSDGDPTDGKPSDGDPTDGDPSDGDPTDGEPSDEEPEDDEANDPPPPEEQPDLEDEPPPRSGKSSPVAVVILGDDYEPVSGYFYLRQEASSEFVGTRLVPAARTDVDTDLHKSFVTGPTEVDDPPPEDGRKEVHGKVAITAEHTNPFALEGVVEMSPAYNPNPARFRRAWEFVSRAPTTPYEDLLGHTSGSEMSDDIRTHYLEFPADDPRYQELADELTSQLQPELADDPFARALVIKQHLDQMAYDTSERHAGADDPTAEFLFEGDEMVGYCVHAAHASVYLLRAAGVPARVGTGYAVEAERRRGSSLVVMGKDAHAWPELYLDGVGWTILDIAPAENRDPPGEPLDEEMADLLSDMAREEPETEQTAGVDWRRLWHATLRTLSNAAIALIALVLVLHYLIKLYRRARPYVAGRRGIARVGYRAAIDRLAEAGIVREEGETRERFARRVGAQVPSFVELTNLHLAATFGPPDRPEPRSTSTWLRLLSRVHRELSKGTGWTRWLGVMNPFSFYRSR